ncbi:MAG TPA: substrate-binding domain-containing protein [Plasticicumulans sp.]|nr:substrate-binding domain-containing protein [Plasticicumulans sp.]
MSAADTATELSLALWALKRALARQDAHAQPDIDRLRVDAAYRDTIVAEAGQSPHEAVREAAARVRALISAAVQEARQDKAARRGARTALVAGMVLVLAAAGVLGWQWTLQPRQGRTPVVASVVPQPAAVVTPAAIPAAVTVPKPVTQAAAPLAAEAVNTPVQLLPRPEDIAPAAAGSVPAAAAASAALPVVPVAALPAAAPVKLRIHGSNTIGAELAPALVERFLARRGASDVRRVPGARAEEMRIEATLPGSEGRIAIELAAHGSGTAFTDLADGRADVGAASRPVRDEEIRKLAALGDFSSPAAEHVIGLDGVAIIVHPANPLRSLSREQVAKLFAGEIRDWAELGGRPGPVHIYARDERSGTWDTFQSLVLGKAYPLSPEAQRFESSPELSDRVATDAGGIGFIGLPYVRMARALAIGDGNAVPSAPSPFTVATEDYPLSRRLFFYLAPTGDNRMARELVEFALENDGQQVVEAHGFISQRVAPQRVALSPNAPKEYESLTRDALRLSVNFRFRPGSGLLDGKAQRDLRRVTDYLAQAENRSRQVLLFGFTDARGSPEQNLRLSQQRAQEIARELQARGIQTRVVRGFGPANPVAADDSPSGQERNRRVEIWVM